jgi:hypothetical protein
MTRHTTLTATALLLAVGPLAARPEPVYVKKATRVESIVASLQASGLPALDGTWHLIGPFDCPEGDFDVPRPPEREIDLKKTYPGKPGEPAAWRKFDAFALGKIVNLKLFKDNDHTAVYLLHDFESPEAFELPLSLGSDDGLAVFFNGERLLNENVVRGATPDQNRVALKVKAGRNRLLLKVVNVEGEFAVYVAPELPPSWPGKVLKRLDRDFPTAAQALADKGAEAKHYRIVTLPVPKECVLEVGGLAVRPDGKLLACTRRGEVWLVHNPSSDDPDKIKFTRYASGLHEALGIRVDGKDVFVVQRPELTQLIDHDGDDVVDEYRTICDKWGVSGDYHEFAFGPARDRQGNFYVTLNVGFGGGHQSKAPWRGWCVKISPKGELTPFAVGLRSPNGINFSPDGEPFYADNQGEWVATNKLHHLREGGWYGHPAGLRWVKQSPFAGILKDSYPSGMLYDGQRGATQDGFPDHEPPAIWFPYGRMGQSASEPIWDATGGKFGPFAGQMLIGDQTKSTVMRVVLEKVNGVYQGACFPFRSGFECGVNRLAFGPDGSLYVGMTNRGWGSVGGKPWGLQRLVYTGVEPFEILTMKVTKEGFDLTFTKPLGPKAEEAKAFALQSFTYNYWSTYGSPEVDHRAEAIAGVKVSADRKTVSLTVPNRRRGRVYELAANVADAAGEPILHPEAYYTLNEVPR